jgi:hypothetical protein
LIYRDTIVLGTEHKPDVRQATAGELEVDGGRPDAGTRPIGLVPCPAPLHRIPRDRRPPEIPG